MSTPSPSATRHSPGRHGQRWDHFLSRTFAQQESGGRLLPWVRPLLRIVIIVFREAVRAKISIRAAALTYSVILAMVPLLAMSTAILKGMGSGDQLKIATERFIEQFEPRPTPSPAENLPEDATGTAVQSPRNTMSGHLYRAVDTIFSYAENTNFAALGAFGIVGTLLVVISVFSSIEEAMLDIWKQRKGRPFLRKVMDYLALLILLPVSINLALAGEAILVNQRMLSHIQSIIPFPWLIGALFKFLPFAFITLTLMLMYLFFSRAKVTTRAAFTGAFFASMFWFFTQKIYILLQVGVSNYNVIYGSFATVPLFLVWVYLGWNFILLGAALAYAVQHQRHYTLDDGSQWPLRRLQLAFDMLQLISSDFQHRTPTTLHSLAERMEGVSASELETIASTLKAARLVHWSRADEQSVLLPVTRRENLTPEEIITAIWGQASETTYGGKMAALALSGAHQACSNNHLSAQPDSEPT